MQVISTYRALKRLFPNADVEVIDYTPLSTFVSLIRGRLSLRHIGRAIAYNRRHYLFKKCRENNLNLSRKCIVTNSYLHAIKSIKDQFDIIVVGSDEVWKIEKGKRARPFPNLYWLGEIGDTKKVAYAASANKTAYRENDDDKKSLIKKYLSSFDLLSVRDTHTIEMAEYSGVTNKIEKIPDPTFVLNFKPLDVKSKLRRIGLCLNKPMVGITLFDSEISCALYQYYSAKGYQVLGLSFYNEHCDFNMYDKLDPLEWASLISMLTVFVTNRFHGVIFSMKTDTPFYCIDETNNYGKYESKIERLLKDCNLYNDYYSVYDKDLHVGDVISRIDRIIDKHNTEQIKSFLDNNRNDGIQFLKKIGSL